MFIIIDEYVQLNNILRNYLISSPYEIYLVYIGFVQFLHYICQQQVGV